MYWVPDPIRPPRANRNTSLSGPSSPPEGERTNPVRRFTTRTPASRARWVAASQSRASSARKPEPDGCDSSTATPPASP